MKMFEGLVNFNCGLLRSLDFWNKPKSPVWRGKSGDEYVHFELTKANFKEFDAQSFEKPEQKQAFIDRIKSPWLAKCALAFKEEDKRAGVDPGIVEATDYQTLARKAWEEGDFEAQYLAQLDHYCHKLISLAGLWAKIIPVVVLVVVVLLVGVVLDLMNRSAFAQAKTRLADAYQSHLRSAQAHQSFVPLIRDIYESENTDTQEARRAFLDQTMALFDKGVFKVPLDGDEEALSSFFDKDLENMTYSDGQGFWFLKKMHLPTLSDTQLATALEHLMNGKQTDPELFAFLDKLHPYTDIDERDFQRLKFLHELADVTPGDETAVERHFNHIKSQLSDLKQAGHLTAPEIEVMETWLDSGCSPEDAGSLLTPTLNPLQASKLVNAINAIKCAKYCDRLTACRNTGAQDQIATCLVDSIEALLTQNVSLNREMLEYVKYRSALVVLQDDPDEIDRLFFDENPQSPKFPGKTFHRPSGTCPEFGEPCDMLPTDKVVKEFAATVALLDALTLRKDEYHKFFTVQGYQKIENGFPDLTIIPGERNLWTVLQPHVDRILADRMKAQADQHLSQDDWVAAFDIYRALIELNDQVHLLDSTASDVINAHLLLCALALHYDHRLKAALEDAPQFIRKFANGDHSFFLQSSGDRLGGNNKTWFRSHLQGKRLVKDRITVTSPTIDKITRYL